MAWASRTSSNADARRGRIRRQRQQVVDLGFFTVSRDLIWIRHPDLMKRGRFNAQNAMLCLRGEFFGEEIDHVANALAGASRR